METRTAIEFILLILILGFALAATNVGKRNLDLIRISLAVASGVVLFLYAVRN